MCLDLAGCTLQDVEVTELFTVGHAQFSMQIEPSCHRLSKFLARSLVFEAEPSICTVMIITTLLL